MDSDSEIPTLIPLDTPTLVDRPAVPVTIITGFLGSGKTTLITSLLADPTLTTRIAVILNEFGSSAGIDKSLSMNAQGQVTEEWLELANGCLCCSVKDSGVKAIENLLKSRHQFDYVLLETTGLADPGPIASLFWLDEQLQSQVYLDGIITVVDAKHIEMQMDSAAEGGQGLNEAVKQIAMADRIIINKTDLVNEQGISAVSTRIRQINSAADIRTTRRSAVASDFILDLHAFDGKQIDPFASVNTGRHVVDKSVTTVSFVCDGLIDKQRLEKWGQTLLWESAITGASSMDKDPKESSLEILRLKALVYVDREFKHVFQAVYQTYDIQKGVKWTDDEPHRSQVVLIGRGLDYQKIYESFKKLVIAD